MQPCPRALLNDCLVELLAQSGDIGRTPTVCVGVAGCERPTARIHADERGGERVHGHAGDAPPRIGAGETVKQGLDLVADLIGVDL